MKTTKVRPYYSHTKKWCFDILSFLGERLLTRGGYSSKSTAYKAGCELQRDYHRSKTKLTKSTRALRGWLGGI